MSVTIRVKRGTEQKILESSMQLGELAFSTDTCSLWGYNGLYKCVVGRAIVDSDSNKTTYSGSVGRLFYGSDTGNFYIHDGAEWKEYTVSGTGSKGDTGFGLFGAARVDGDGTVLDSVNLIINRSITGTYDCTFSDIIPTDANHSIHVQPYQTVTDTNAMVSNITSAGFRIEIGQGDNGGSPDTLLDTDFSVAVFRSEGLTASGYGATTFLELLDTPITYSGSEDYYLKVTSSGIEFSPISISSTFTDLTDTPVNYVGAAGKYLQVNSTEDGIQFTAVSGTSSDLDIAEDCFHAYLSADQSVGSTWGDITWDQEIFSGNSYSFTAPSSEITFTASGIYEVTYYMDIDVYPTDTSRTSSQVKIQEYNGLIWQDIPGTFSNMYHRNYNQGATNASVTIIRDMYPNYKLRIQAQRQSGGSDLFAVGGACGVTIKNAQGVRGNQGEQGPPGQDGEVTLDQLTSTSGVLVDYIDQQIATVSGGGGYESKLISCYDTSGGLDVNTSSWNVINWNSEVVKDTSFFTHSNSTNPSRINIQADGLYRMTYTVAVQGQFFGFANLHTAIGKNGSSVLPRSHSYCMVWNNYGSMNNTCVQELNTGDYIEIGCRGEGATGNVLTLADESQILVEFIR